MPNAENIEKHKFTSENQPKKRRSRKGVPNRATVLQKYLKQKIKFPNKNQKGEKVFETLDEDISITAEEGVMLSLIAEAMRGNVTAIREIQDTVHGKIKEESDINISGGLDVNIQSAIDKIYDGDGENSKSDD
jgi:hypothetical protein